MVFESISGSIKSYKLAIDGGIEKTAALENAARGVWQSMSMFGKFTIAATAITGIITAIQAIKRHREEIIQQAQENAEAYNDEVESLQDYRNEVELLTKSIESGTLSNDELYKSRSKLKEIQDSLEQTYGSSAVETAGMKLLTSSTNEAADAFDKLEESRAKAYLSENGSRGLDSLKKMNEQQRYIFGHFAWDKLSGGAQEALSDIVAMNDNLQRSDGYVTGLGETFRLDVVGKAEDAKEAANELRAALDALETPVREELEKYLFNGSGSVVTFANATSNIMSGVNEIIDDHGATAETYLDAVITGNAKLSSIKKDLISAENAYESAVLSTYNTEEERSAAISQAYNMMDGKIKKYNDAVRAGDVPLEFVRDHFDQMVSGIQDNMQMLELDIDMSDAINGKNMDDAAKAMMGGLGKSLEAFADGNGDIFASDILSFGLDKDSWDANNLTDMQKAYLALDAIAGHYNTTVEGLLNTAKEHNLVIGSTSQLLGDAKKAYEKYTGEVKAVNDVIDAQVAGQSISLETYESLIAVSDKYADALESEGGVMQFNADKLREITEARNANTLATINNNRKDSEKQYIKNAESIKKLRKELEGLTAGEIDARNEKKALIAALEAENKEVAQAIDKYNIMASQIAEMNSKRRAWLDAQNDPLPGAALGDASDALKHINDVLNKRNSGVFGDIGTTKYKAAIDFVIPEDINTNDKKAINKYMNSLRKYLQFDSSGGLKGINIDNIVKKLTGGKDPFFGKNKDGSYFVQEGKNLKDFADALGVTLEMAEAIIGMMNQKGWDLNLDPIDSMVDKYERAADAREKLLSSKTGDVWNIKIDFSDIEKAEDKIAAIDNSIAATIRALKNSGGLGTELGDAAADILDYLYEQKKMLENPIVMNIDTSTLTGDTKTAVDAFQGLIDAWYEYKEAQDSGDKGAESSALKNIKDFVAKIKDLPNLEDFGINLSDLINLDDDTKLVAAAESIKTALQSLDTSDWIKIGIPEDQIATLRSTLDGVTEEVRNVIVHVDGAGEVEAAIELIKNLKGKTVVNTIITVYRTSGGSGTRTSSQDMGDTSSVAGGYSGWNANGTAHAFGTARASGDWRTKRRERALMGELGEEILINPYTGRWRTVGSHGAEFVDVPKGSIIFNHLQTRHLLRNGYVTSRGKLNGKAYASGTAFASGSPGVSGGSGSWKPSSGSGKIPVTITGGAASSGGGGLFRDKDHWEGTYKWRKHLLEIEEITFEEYLKWLEAAFADADKHGIIAYEDTFQYIEEIFEGKKKLFEDMLNDAEHEIESLGRESGNESQIINIYLDMIKSIEAQITAAKERGLDENSDYIQELQDKIWDYEDEVKDLRDDATDDAKDAVKDLVDYRIDMLKKDLENEKDALDKKLDDLREFYDKQKELLQETRDEEEYIEEQSEKRKVKNDILSEIDRLKRDNSAWAKKRVLELEQELAEAEKELTEFEKDNALDKAIEVLDDLYERQEKDIESQIESVDKMLNDPEALYNQALRDIQNNSLALYEEMVEYNNRHGSGNQEDTKKMWDEAKESLDKYLTTFGQAYKDIVLVASPSSGYASGTRYATKGVHKIDELGPEYVFTSADGSRYRMFSGGEKVLNANATNFLYNFATSGGKLLSRIYDGITKTAGEIGSLISRSSPLTITTGDVVVQGNADHTTVSELRRLKRDEMQWILKEFNKMNRRS